MTIKVSCPTDSWPNTPTSKVLPDLTTAQKWAEWGHCCVRGDLHNFTETEEKADSKDW